MKFKKEKWFSLVIAMLLVIVMTTIAIVVLDFAIPFSRDINGIENASNSYYQANSWFEQAIYFISQNPIWSESWKVLPSTQTGYSFNIFASWSISPALWKWNSDFDSDWNKISEWNSIQMEIWYNKIADWANTKAYFRVPNLNGDWWLSLAWNKDIVTWKLTSSGWNLLIASWSEIKANEVCSSSWTTTHNACIDTLNFNGINLWGEDLNWNWNTFQSFYGSYCSSSCILKISIINDLNLSSNNAIVPYLEWKISFWTSPLPTRYADINVSWKSYWFKKDLKFSVPQKSILDTFDFAVFQ